ncbi:MAG: copper amine oxidase N-terminal domain-containing protein [Clostridia bacterium]|nr:copper amine oxidase N-terminal domain-containing protein [Clostridia bacterium]
MKKLCFCILLALIILIFSTQLTYAASNVVEAPHIKIVIEGKMAEYKEVPLLVNGRTLLPLRAILKDLGVPDDDAHIMWNQSEKSVTVCKDSKKIFLKVNSNTALVNDSEVKLDAAPVNYKSRVYIPVRFVSQALDKKVVWDGTTYTVYLREQKEFDRIGEIITRANETRKRESKFKASLNMSIAIGKNNTKLDISTDMKCEIDEAKQLSHMLTEMNTMGKKTATEYYLSGNIRFARDSVKNIWEKQDLTQLDISKLMYSQEKNGMIEATDINCAGLTAEENSESGELVLKGNVYLHELMSKSTGSLNAVNSIRPDKCYTEIAIDSKSYLYKRFKVNISGDVKINNSDQRLESSIYISYSDYGGDFDISLPDEVKNLYVLQ